MTRLPIPFLHLWRPMVWGFTPFHARECRICGRFEVFAYGYWSHAPGLRNEARAA